MIVRSHNCEMGYEGIAAIPYAYALHLQRKLTGTVSGTGSEAFYYFSPDHQIDPTPRDFAHTAAAAKEIPNMWIHKPKLDKTNWVPPPYKEHYGKQALRFEKPTVVIYNRKNLEWGRQPINYFDLGVLRELFSLLCQSYSVVYFNVRGREELEDNAHSMDLGDYDMIRSEFPDVRIVHDLVDEHGGDYNTVQMRVFAGCEKFITMNGFPSILASYFGGENIIYSKECRELGSSVNSFFSWYQDFGGSHIRLVQDYASLLDAVRIAWVEERPLINILVRCHNRPKGLQRLIESVGVRHDVRIICSYDNEETWRYLSKARVEKMGVTPEPPQPPPAGKEHRKPLPANLYFNQMYERVQRGYVMFLDDDDILLPGAIDTIQAAVDPDALVLWRVRARNGALVPEDEYMGMIEPGHISGIGIAFHNKWIPLAQWTPWRRGDYRVAKSLASALNEVWLTDVLTAMEERLDDKPLAQVLAESKAVMDKKKEEINKAVAESMSARKVARAESPLPNLQKKRRRLTNRGSRRSSA